MASMGITFIMAGTGFYSFGVLLKPLMTEFGWSRGAVSIAQSIYLLMSATSGLAVGKLAERYSMRKIVLVGTLLGATCWFLLSLTTSLWYMYTLYFFLGIGLGGGAGLVPVGVIVSNWFSRRRGTAMGIATAGIALGAMILAPLLGVIIENFGWRMSYIFMGLVMLVVDIPIASLVLKGKPEEKGLLPDGDQVPSVREGGITEPSNGQPVEISKDPRQEGSNTWIKSMPLWLLCFGFTLAQIGSRFGVTREYARQVLRDASVPTRAVGTLCYNYPHQRFCLNCGKVRVPSKKEFCSRKCRSEYATIQVACAQCGVLFQLLRGSLIFRVSRQKNFFCSHQCSVKYYW